MIGFSSMSTQATDADLYALVYPTTHGRQLTDLYNSDATAQDEIDKFLNNQPSLLDAFNGGTTDSPGLGTRKLYLFRNTKGAIPAMVKTNQYAYIYFDTAAGYAKIQYSGVSESNKTYTSISKAVKYKKILTDATTANQNGWSSMPNMFYYDYTAFLSADADTSTASSLKSTAYIKIKTSGPDADLGGDCYFRDTTLSFGSINITGYEMLTTDDCFLPVYKTIIVTAAYDD